MLVFLIPLMSRSVSTSWDLTIRLLQNTLRSICSQTHSSFAVVVTCHDKPNLGMDFPKVEFVQVDFKIQLSSSDTPEVCPIGSEIKSADKGRKLLRSFLEAQKYNPSHVMFVDADDLVNCRLAEQCATEPECNGWAIEQGYRYTLGSKWIYKKRKNFHLECATGAIFRNDLVPVPEFPRFDLESRHYSFFINHGYHVTRMINRGQPLRNLPYPGAIAVMHGSNWSVSEGFIHSRVQDYLMKPLKLSLNLRPLTDSIRREFGMV